MNEQSARQRLGQHWFITAYIAVYIQGLYTVYNDAEVRSTVAVLGLATNQGRRQPPQTPQLHSHSFVLHCIEMFFTHFKMAAAFLVNHCDVNTAQSETKWFMFVGSLAEEELEG